MNRFGFNEKDFLIFQNLVLNPLKNMNAKVYIFGSRARGDFKEFSDVDVLFDIPDNTKFDSLQLFLIKSAIEESNFSFKVDLVNIKELAPSYKDQILKDRVEV